MLQGRKHVLQGGKHVLQVGKQVNDKHTTQYTNMDTGVAVGNVPIASGTAMVSEGHGNKDHTQGQGMGTFNKIQHHTRVIEVSGTSDDHKEGVNMCGEYTSSFGHLYITTRMEGHSALALLDTGCIRNIMSLAMFRRLRLQQDDLEACDIKLESASGSKIDVYGTLRNVQLHIGEGVCEVLDCVVASITEDLILGSQFMENAAASLDFKALTITIKRKAIPMIKAKSGQGRGLVKNIIAKEVKKGRSVLMCRIEGEAMNFPSSYYYKPADLWDSDHQQAIVNVHGDIIEVIVENASGYPMTIEEGEVVGTISEVTKGDLLEEAETWNWSEDQRTELIVQQLKIEENSLLDAEKKKIVKDLVRKYNDVFSLSKKEIGLTDLYVHKIKLKNEDVVINKNRPIPMHKFAEAKKTMTDLIEMGVLEPSTSHHRSPLVLVSKKTGGKRFCADFRRLNQLIEDCEHPLPTVWETRNVWAGCKWFSVLDLSSAYFQIPLSEDSRDLTTIWVNGIGSYRFTRAPMGAKSSGTALQSLTDKVFIDLKKSVCSNFLDDIISGSKTFEEMVENLGLLFDRLRMAGLKIKATKTEIFKDSVRYLGCRLDSQGLSANMDKVGDLLLMERPNSKKAVQKFMGLANYFKEFIEKFSDKAKGLNDLLKNKTFVFDDAAEKSFTELKKALANPPVLAWPQEDREFHLYTDASSYATGCVLMQYGDDDKLHPVFYGSKSLREDQMHWASFVKEYYSIYVAVKRLEFFLIGKRFTIHTDCEGLTYSKALKKCTANAIVRWSIELSQHEFDIEFVRGENNSPADAMSRLPKKSEDLYDYFVKGMKDIHQKEEINKIMSISDDARDDKGDVQEKKNKVCDGKDDTSIDNLMMQQKQSEEAAPVKKSIVVKNQEFLRAAKDDPTFQVVNGWIDGSKKCEDPMRLEIRLRRYWNKLDLISVNEQGLLCRKYFENTTKSWRMLICVPEKLVQRIVTFYHEKVGCHLSSEKTRNRILQKFWFPNNVEEVDLICKTCSQCFRTNLLYKKKEHPPLKPFIYKYPGLSVGMDVVKVRKGNKESRILTIVDRFTKWVKFVVIKDETALTIAKALMQWVCQWGPMEILLSDNAKSFKEAAVMKELYGILGLEKKYTSNYHPEANGESERYNKILIHLLLKLTNDRPNTWKNHLDLLALAVNSGVNRSTGFSPFRLMTGREMPGLDNIVFDAQTTDFYQSEAHLVSHNLKEMRRIFAIASDNLEIYHQLQKKVYDRNKSCIEIVEGDRVLLHRPKDTSNEFYKLTSSWVGPFVVKSVYSQHNFLIERESDGKQEVVNRSHIRKLPDDIRGSLARPDHAVTTQVVLDDEDDDHRPPDDDDDKPPDDDDDKLPDDDGDDDSGSVTSDDNDTDDKDRDEEENFVVVPCEAAQGSTRSGVRFRLPSEEPNLEKTCTVAREAQPDIETTCLAPGSSSPINWPALRTYFDPGQFERVRQGDGTTTATAASMDINGVPRDVLGRQVAPDTPAQISATQESARRMDDARSESSRSATIAQAASAQGAARRSTSSRHTSSPEWESYPGEIRLSDQMLTQPRFVQPRYTDLCYTSCHGITGVFYCSRIYSLSSYQGNLFSPILTLYCSSQFNSATHNHRHNSAGCSRV